MTVTGKIHKDFSDLLAGAKGCLTLSLDIHDSTCKFMQSHFNAESIEAIQLPAKQHNCSCYTKKKLHTNP
jgi:hypothetical protein